MNYFIQGDRVRTKLRKKEYNEKEAIVIKWINSNWYVIKLIDNEIELVVNNEEIEKI